MKLLLVVGTASAYLADWFEGSYPDSPITDASDRSSDFDENGKCDPDLMPSVYGGGWVCHKKGCTMQCNAGGEANATVKCSKGMWFGSGSTDTCEIDESSCDTDQLATVEFGHWNCQDDECLLECDSGDIPLNDQGSPVSTTCEDGTWWINQIEPECPAPTTLTGRASKKAKKCKMSALPAVDGGEWECDKKNSHCDLNCHEGKDGYCLVQCANGYWEINGKLECKTKSSDESKKKKKKKNKEKGQDKPKPEEGIPKCNNIPKPNVSNSGGSWNCMEMNGYYGCALMCNGQKAQPEKNIICKCANNCKSNYKTYGWFGNAPTMECPKPVQDAPGLSCKVQDLKYVADGSWVCRTEMVNYQPKLVCDLKCLPGYEGESEMQCRKGNWICDSHRPKCKKMSELPHPVGIPAHMCPSAKKPTVDKAYWTCKDMPQGPICWLKCLNGHEPKNKYGDWVAIKCNNQKWWANDPCIGEMCPEPTPKPEKPDKPDKPKPDHGKCKESRLPNVKNGYWKCSNQQCTLYCENGNKTSHKMVCRYGSWYQKNEDGKCSCPKGGKPIGKPEKPQKPQKPEKPEDPWGKPDRSCKEKDLPGGTGGEWRCEVFDGMYGCVLMCNGKKSTITAVCRDSKWWGNHQEPKCPKDGNVCDQYDLEGPETGGSWTCEYNSCVFMCDANGKQDKMYAECGRKGTWKYNNRIDSCKMNNPSKPKPPSNSGGSCNQNKTPHVDGGYWECKKGHCSLKCDSGKPKGGKCTVSCVKGQWEVKGDPRCKGASSGSSKNKKPSTYSEPSKNTCPKFYEIPHGWMECHQGSEPVECMLMCDKGYTADVNYFSQVFADCENGNMYPPGPYGKGSKWKCVKGYCDHNKWKRVCYDHPLNKGQSKPKGH